MESTTLADLRPGKCAVITGFADENVPLKLLEMGLLPDNEVCVKGWAPLKDPIHIVVAGYEIALRKDEAKFVLVVPVNIEAQLEI